MSNHWPSPGPKRKRDCIGYALNLYLDYLVCIVDAEIVDCFDVTLDADSRINNRVGGNERTDRVFPCEISSGVDRGLRRGYVSLKL
jgi:hypothetical protein